MRQASCISVNSKIREERPLSGLSKLALISGAGLTTLVVYGFILLSILLLLALLAFELLLVLAAARVGVSGIIVRIMEPHLAQVGIFFRNLVLRRRHVALSVQL